MRKGIIVLLALLVVFAASSKALMVGVEDGTPYLRFPLNSGQAIDVGGGYTSTANGATTNLTIFGRLNNKIATYGKITTSWGATLGLNSGLAAGVTTTTIGLTGLLSASYEILDNLVIYGNVNLITLANVNAGGSSSTAISLISGSPNAYSGIRIYLPL